MYGKVFTFDVGTFDAEPLFVGPDPIGFNPVRLSAGLSRDLLCN